MARKKQTPKKTKKRVALTTISPTVRGTQAPGFTTTHTPPLPSQKTWERMMDKLDATYNTDQAMLDKYHEPTDTQWDAIEASDKRYKRPGNKRRKKTTPKSKKKTKTRVKKKIPVKRNSKKVCVTLMEIARKFPDIAKQVCFHPKVSSFKSIMGTPASSKRKVSTFM